MVPEVPTATKVLFPNPTPLSSFEVGEVTVLKDEPLSVDLTMVPEVPTPTKVLFPNPTPQRLFEVGEVTLSKDAPLSVDLTMVTDSPTPTNLVVSSVVLVVVPEFSVDSSFSSLQEMTVKLKRKRERIMSRCFTWFPIGVLGEPYIYHNSGCFTRIGDFTWRVSDCQELVGVYSQEMM